MKKDFVVAQFTPYIRGFIGLVIVVLMVSSLTFAGNPKVGTTDVFLKLGLGARPAAMGNAFGAIADDVNSISWNPAGLGLIQKKEVEAMYTAWFQGISYQYVAMALPLPKIGSFGFAFNTLSAGTLEGRTDDTDTFTAFTASNLSLTVAYSRGLLNDKLLVGLGAKLIMGTIENTSATPGFGIDVGGLYKLNDKLRLGLALQNLGAGLKYISTANALPLNFKIAAAYQPIAPLTVGADLNMPSDSDINIALGAEYKLVFGDIGLPLRLGFNTGKSLGGITGLAAGLGIIWKDFLGFDFAWVPADKFGDTYHISLKAKF